ncbi:MAG TPA: hypothetical protein VLV48_10660 [Thermoanaerobaculia bacterium]|nr:hypothetical protein [Thermoanaerobaculia bacterium]
MSRYPTRNPPTPLGEISLTFYDQTAWENAREEAAGWRIDLGLYVEYALRHYFRAKMSKMRLARWRHDRDMQDPDLRVIREFLKTEDAEHEEEPEYLKEKYLPKSKRKAKR